MGINVTYTADQTNKPYWAWNRIEARPRKKDFSRVFKAQVHDPLWMLGRQWQMGEFDGSDTGSGIFARLEIRHSQMSGTNVDGNYSAANLPIEPVVERIKHRWSMKERLLLGKKWLQIMKEKFSSAPNAPVPYENFRAAFLDPANLCVIDMDEPVANDPDLFQKAERFSDKKVYSFQKAVQLADIILDGGKLFDDFYPLSTNSAAVVLISSALPSGYNIPVTGGDIAIMESVVQDFKAWVIKMYSLPNAPLQEAWNKEAMEYNFEAYWPKDGVSDYTLMTNGYHHGRLDWYSFMQTADESGSTQPSTKGIQVIMSEARFSGMPNSRWWEFENGGVNFTELDANTTDLAKIIMAQFALVYQDDWFLVPNLVNVGSYNEITGIVVTDVFGVRTFVPHHTVKNYTPQSGFEVDSDWASWRWMDVGVYDSNTISPTPAGKLLLPPVVNKIMESKPFESVLFIRDEMSNYVWGIEQVVPDHLGKGIDGDNKAEAFLNYIKTINQYPDTSGASAEIELSYELNNTVIPENWIPFIAVHTANSIREMRLQRASMPRILSDTDKSLVRPRTGILRYSMNDATNQPTAAYFVNEEEVPRAGALVSTTYQRCRWYNGKVVSWVGRKKTTGRGEGASGLIFDKIVQRSTT